MFKPSIDQMEDFLNMVAYECPKRLYGELSEFQCDCEDVSNCYNCWYNTVYRYQVEQSLKSMNDEEDN